MGYSTIDDEEQELYLDVLREGTTPFDRFVSRGDVEDPVDISNPRREIDRTVLACVRRTVSDKTVRFIPMLGSAGSGKTHAFWAFKDMERRLLKEAQASAAAAPEGEVKPGVNWTIVYIPSPPTSVRMLFHMYTCIINEIPDTIDYVSKSLVKTYGGEKKKFGLFGKADIDEVIAKAAGDYPGVFADCVKTLITYGMSGDSSKRAFAKRWLLGEVIEEEELEELKIQSVIEQDDVCLAMIKLIAQHLNKVMVLYFDEFESPYRTYGAEAEIKFLETLKRIYNEVQNVVIIAAILKDIWSRILEVADPPFKSRMEPEVELKPFSFGDVKIWFAKSQEHFWEMNNLNPPTDPLFPLNEHVLRIIYDRTHGNPRETIKLTRVFIDKIIFGDLLLSEVTAETKPTEIASKLDGALAEPVIDASKPSASQKIEDIIDKEGLIIDVNPASVLGAAIKGLQGIGEKTSPPVEIKASFEYKYFVGGKEKEIGAMVECNGEKIGFDVPSVKTFDRSGGVAAFYSAKRLVDGLTNNTFLKAFLIMPESTSGEKTQYLFEHNPGLRECKLNQAQAEDLIRCALDPDKEFSKENYDLFNAITGLALARPEPPSPVEGEAPSQ